MLVKDVIAFLETQQSNYKKIQYPNYYYYCFICKNVLVVVVECFRFHLDGEVNQIYLYGDIEYTDNLNKYFMNKKIFGGYYPHPNDKIYQMSVTYHPKKSLNNFKKVLKELTKFSFKEKAVYEIWSSEINDDILIVFD